MLNELQLLANSLESKGLSVESWDSRIKSYKKGPAYVVRFGPDGRIARVQWIDAENVGALRRISPQNEMSFPGFNLNHSIYAVEPSVLRLPDELWSAVVCNTSTLTMAGEKKDRRALSFNLRYPVEELGKRFAGVDAGLVPTKALIERIARLDGEKFLQELAEALISSVTLGELDRGLAILLLFGKLNAKKNTVDPSKATIILEIDDSAQLGGRVASPESARAWNRALLEEKGTASGAEIRCALSGGYDTSIGEKMPQPNLPALGLTYLMSMNAATPCQMRYRLTSSAVYPIGRIAGQKVTDALQFITDAGREGITFARIPNAYSDNSDLLISYLEEDPASSLPIADLFADLGQGPEGDAAEYEARTSSLLQKLRGVSKQGNDSGIRIFAINKLDPGRSQVLFSGRYSVHQLEAGTEEWFAGLSNIPTFNLLMPGAKGKKAQLENAARPSPIDVLRSFKLAWIRGGRESSAVPGIDLSQIYRLMLDRDLSQASPLLSRYLNLIRPLLLGVGALRGDLKALPERSRREALKVIPVLGLLLLKLGHPKELYMQSREFYLGQYLQLADRLHKLYCEVVRKGDVPPQLAGNSAMSAALQNPERAFSTASQRIKVYLAWADSFKKDDRVGLAIWIRQKIREVCARLSETGFPERIDDAGRAQLFLGYLAEINQKEKAA